MYASTLLLGALAAAAASAQAPQLGYFFLEGFLPTSQGSGVVSAYELKANGGNFYANKATNASCPNGAASCCFANTRTSLVVFGNENSAHTSASGPLYLNTAGAGNAAARQQVFCQAGGPLKYTAPGAAVPNDAPWRNFTYKPEASRSGYGSVTAATTFTICKLSAGEQQVFCKGSQPAGLTCVNSTLATRPDFNGIAAGQYNS